MKIQTAMIVFLAGLIIPGILFAGGEDIFFARYSPDSVNFDGEIDDWIDAGYVPLILDEGNVAVGMDGWEGEEDMWLKVYLAYDEESLYVALKAKEDKHARTKKFEPDEDHVEIWIKVPSPEGEELKVISYYPGRMFPTFKGGIRWMNPDTGKSKPVKGAKFYEKPEKKQWQAELVIPWKSMPDVWKKLPSTLWGIAVIDCDNYHVRTRESILATGWSGGQPKLEVASVEEVENIAETFLEQQGSKAVKIQRQYADVAGDGREEVILQADNNYAVFGHGFKDGQGYVYISIPVKNVKHIEYAGMKDLTGDGKKDFIFKYKQMGENWRRRIYAVYSFRGEDVGRVFAQDVERKVGDKIATSKIEILEDAMQGKSLIKVTPGEVKGWTKADFNLETEMDVQGVVLPWEEETTKYYIYREGGFEAENTPAVEKYLASPKKKKIKKKKKKKKKK